MNICGIYVNKDIQVKACINWCSCSVLNVVKVSSNLLGPALLGEL